FGQEDYRCGAVVIDAALFVPQSRPRLFVIGVRGDIEIPAGLETDCASAIWHTRGLATAYDALPAAAKKNWIWWDFPEPPQRNSRFADLIEDDPTGVDWHTPEETRRLLGMMSKVNLAKVEKAKRAGRRMVGA